MRRSKRVASLLMGLVLCMSFFGETAYGEITDGTKVKDPYYLKRWIKPGSKAVALKNVSYELAEHVITTEGTLGEVLDEIQLGEEIINQKPLNISQKDKLKYKGFIQDTLAFTYLGDKVKAGDVYFDAANNLAIKVVDDAFAFTKSGEKFVQVQQPQLHEVFNEIVIPDQQVTLNPYNIVYENEDLLESRISTGSIHAMGALAKSYVPKKLKDPLVEYSFNESYTTGISESGENIELELDGYLGIDTISVETKYSRSDGYKLIASTGEEMNLTARLKMDIEEEIRVPIFGFSVNAGDIGEVKGGLFLLIGVDGNLSVVTQVNQWATMEMGIYGSTFFYIPTSIHKKKKFDSDITVDVEVNGKMDSYIKLGPEVGFEVAGMDVIGLRMYLGSGLESEIDGAMLDIDVYMSLEAGMSILGDNYKFINEKKYLFEKTQLNTAGYTFEFLEACAYQDVIWMKVMDEEEGAREGISVVLQYYDPLSGRRQQIEETSDDQGYILFNKDTWDLKITDEISIYSIDGILFTDAIYDRLQTLRDEARSEEKTKEESDLERLLEDMVIHPTYPFKIVYIDYADFLNDSVVGSVVGSFTRNWRTGEKTYMPFEGELYFQVYENEVEVDSPEPVETDGEGNFRQTFDFKPKQEVIVGIYDDGIRLRSEQVETDVDLSSTRVLVDVGTYQYVEDGHVVDAKEVYETIIIRDKRGDASFDQKGTFENDYYKNYALTFVYDPFTGRRLKEADLVGEVDETLTVAPLGQGVSGVESGLITEYQWAKENKKDTNKFEIKVVEIDKGEIDQYDSTPIKFRLESEIPYSQREDGSIDEAGLEWISRRSRFVLEYEGARLEFSPPYDTQETGEGREWVNLSNNPIETELINTIWSRINPNPIERLNPADNLVNVYSIPEWSQSAIIMMVNMQIMDVGADQQFPSGQYMTRGQVASCLARMFQLPEKSKKMTFKDISDTYKYAKEVESCYQAGIIKGIGGGKFNPEGMVTRQEAAVMLMRALQYRGMKSNSARQIDVNFKDKKEMSQWSKEGIEYVYRQGLFKGDENGNFNPKANITFDEMALILKRILTK